MLSAALVATVLAGEGGAGGNSPVSVSSSSTLPVAIVGAISIVVVALVPELFRWLRRNAPENTPTAVVTPQALEAAEARIAAVVEVKVTQALERANAARAEVRALRKALDLRDENYREDLQGVRDELNRHMWAGGHQPGDVPTPRQPAG